MIDFGFDKVALIGAVALIVIGPEKLPRVARTVGHLLGKAQRYVADVKAEVNRSIELEELKKMKGQFEDAARDVEKNVADGLHQTTADLHKVWEGDHDGHVPQADLYHPGLRPVAAYKPPRKNWRTRRAAMPQWYKQRQNVRTRVQSGAARVARFRPPRRPV